jgi:hypothetical protein
MQLLQATGHGAYLWHGVWACGRRQQTRYCCVCAVLPQEPLPHVSLAWAPGNKAAQLQPWLEAFTHEPIELKVGGVEMQTTGCGMAGAQPRRVRS